MKTAAAFFFVSIIAITPALAQSGKAMRGMSPTERRQFIQNDGMRGKCNYERRYNRCMANRGYFQFSNAIWAERCSRVLGCV